MKPIRLTVQAFGPYAERETFDFADLKGRSLFLISGPTGSGKSTVLDAICCALYGSTSGGDRTPDQMRSQHAEPGLATEVTFDFELGPKSYRVSRCLEHERPRKKGVGTMTQPQTATIWDITGIGDPAVDGVPLASQWDKVTKKVEEVLGFRDDEFRQVVLIPQGKFRELLMADSKAREDILVTLFRTRHYNTIERALKDAFLGVERTLNKLKQNREGVLKVEEVPSLEALAVRADALEVERIAADGLAETARGRKAQTDQSLAEGRRVKALLDERDAARSSLGILDAQKDRMDALRAEAARGRAAGSLRDAKAEATRRAAEWQDRHALETQATQALLHADDALRAASTVLAAQRALEPEQADLQRKSVSLDALVERVAGIAQARTAAESADRNAAALQARLGNAKQSLDRLAQELTNGKANLDEAERVAGTLEASGLVLQRAKEALQQRNELGTARTALDSAVAAQGTARLELEGLRRRYDEAHTSLERAEDALREGAAGLLAGTLLAGEPCPVCGSTSHPMPAQVAVDMPAPAGVEAQRVDLRALAVRVQAATEHDTSLQARVATAKGRVEALVQALGPKADATVQDLEREFGEARQRADGAFAAVRTREDLGKLRLELEGRHALSTAALESLQQEASLAGGALEAARAALTERESAVPEAWRQPAALERERVATAQRFQSLKQALEQAMAHHQACTNRRAVCDADLKTAVSVCAQAKALADQRQAAFRTRLAEAGFADEGQHAEALRSDEELVSLDGRLDAWTRALAAARDRLERSQTAADGAILPDLAVLAADAAQADQALEAALNLASRLAQQVEQKRTTLATLRKDAEAMAELERDFAVLGSLSEVANGRNNLNITFQRYVLGALLDDVLVAATVRLKTMSAGRYLLQRVGTVADRRRPSGLDLEVMDTYTGLARPVGTLSGGESFMAALSLALGMADVVQSYSGGIRLETVFIDEGFGSLDPEALDQALKELVKLKDSGRLVGIISHVPELKQRIDARLEVTAGRTGSHASFVVG